jgi:hypothetical protein
VFGGGYVAGDVDFQEGGAFCVCWVDMLVGHDDGGGCCE